MAEDGFHHCRIHVAIVHAHKLQICRIYTGQRCGENLSHFFGAASYFGQQAVRIRVYKPKILISYTQTSGHTALTVFLGMVVSQMPGKKIDEILYFYTHAKLPNGRQHLKLKKTNPKL